MEDQNIKKEDKSMKMEAKLPQKYEFYIQDERIKPKEYQDNIFVVAEAATMPEFMQIFSYFKKPSDLIESKNRNSQKSQQATFAFSDLVFLPWESMKATEEGAFFDLK